jgi:hypothetical protein
LKWNQELIYSNSYPLFYPIIFQDLSGAYSSPILNPFFNESFSKTSDEPLANILETQNGRINEVKKLAAKKPIK